MHKYIDKIANIVVGYLPKIAGAIIVAVVGFWLINRVSRIISRAMEVRDLDVSLRGFLKSLFSITLKVLLLFTVAGMLGIETTSFVTILGAASLAIGLALQGSLSNFAGGVLILIFKPFKVGDVIDAQGKIGRVQEIQIFNTILLMPNNQAVIIPNGPLSNGTIVNISKEGTLVFEIKVDIDNRHSFEEVKALIMPILEADIRILNPKVGISKLGAVTTIDIGGTTDAEIQALVVGALNVAIKKTLDKNNIKIGFMPMEFRSS